MTYNYKCPRCAKETTITKPMAESSRVEKCPMCDSVMVRVWNAPSISTGDGLKR